LDKLKRVEKQRNTVHDKVCTTYTVFEADGEKYVQFDMYGRTERENPEKISQTIQLDRKTARFLVNLLSQEFGLK
jgi:putative heme degradation protein